MVKRKTNKSEAIRQYLAQQPEKSAADVAKALNVQPSLVYQVKAALKKQKPVRQVARKKTRKRAAHAEAKTSVDQVIAAARLIQTCGGIELARQALKAAEQVADALES